MARGTLKQSNFGGGQISPLLVARADLQKHQTGMKTARNVIPLPQGAFMKRPGSKWIWYTKVAADAARVFPFEFSTTAAYVVLAGDLTFRFVKDYDLVTDTAQAITSISKANPAVVTYVGADTFANGDRVRIVGGEMVELHNREFTVANLNAGANTFELSGVNSTSYTTYVAGGTVEEIYEIASPYTDDQLANVSIVQSADTLFMFHPSVAPYKLTRTADNAWTMTAMTFTDGPFAPINNDPSIRVRIDGTSYRAGKSVTIYANSDIFASTDVGSLFYMEEIYLDQILVTPWASLTAFTSTIGTQYSSNGHVYSLIAVAGAAGTGSVAPSHTEGDAWDGNQGATDRNKFRYLHSRYCVLQISAYTSAKQVTATVITYAPDGLDQPAQNITGAVSSGGLILITIANHGYADGDRVHITGVTGTTEANGYWAITYVSANTFTLDGSTFTNAYVANGTATRFSTWLWAFGAFSATRGYPSCGTFYQDRLVLASTTEQPDSVWASVTSNYDSFADKSHGTVRDDSAVSFTLASQTVNRIRWLSSDDSGLLAGTAGAEWLIRPAANTRPFAPGNIDAKPQSRRGSKAVAPVLVGDATIFVQKSGKRVIEAFFDAGSDKVVTSDLTLISNTITKDAVVEMAYVQDPDGIAWMARGDGGLVGLTYNREQQIAGFHEHVLGGTSTSGGADAVVESVCSIPSPDGTRNDLYMIVKRYIGAATVRHLEYMDRSWDIDEGAIEDQYFVDGGATYDGSSTSTINGLYFLRSETLQCLVDGALHPDVTVSATGTVTLDYSGSVVQLGYAYDADGAMLPSDFGSQDGTASGKTKKISELKLWVYRSATFEAGPDEDNLDPIVMRSSTDDTDTPTELKTDIYALSWPDGYSMQAPVLVRQSAPMAMAVMALIPSITVHDG